MERVMGIEPTQPAWKAGILAIELHPHVLNGTHFIISQRECQDQSAIFLCMRLAGACRIRRDEIAIIMIII